MDREIVLLALGGVLIGAAVPIGALIISAFSNDPDVSLPGCRFERTAATRLLLPLVPALLAGSMLTGWALVEPEDAERVPGWIVLVWLPLVLVWLRTAARSLRSLAPREIRSAATIGVLRPRIVVTEAFRIQLDEDAFVATLAHENAHARHRDPFRIWFAQIVTDLQWPLPGAKARFDRWLFALELARDEEARATVDGTDLAAAVIAAQRVEQSSAFAFASIAPADVALGQRLHRLLAPLPESEKPRSGRPDFGLLSLSLAIGMWVGAGFGEVVVKQVLGWGR